MMNASNNNKHGSLRVRQHRIHKFYSPVFALLFIITFATFSKTAWSESLYSSRPPNERVKEQYSNTWQYYRRQPAANKYTEDANTYDGDNRQYYVPLSEYAAMLNKKQEERKARVSSLLGETDRAYHDNHDRIHGGTFDGHYDHNYDRSNEKLFEPLYGWPYERPFDGTYNQRLLTSENENEFIGQMLSDQRSSSFYTPLMSSKMPDPSYSSFVQFSHIPDSSEQPSSVKMKYVSKCNNTLFMTNVEDSAKFQHCFFMAEKLLCAGDSANSRTYKLMLGDTLYKHCFQFMNLNSLQVATVKQLHIEKTKVEVYCENSIPVTRCQCNNYLIEQERKYNTEKRFLNDKVSTLTNDFDSCRIAREALTIANESAILERDRRNSRIETLISDVTMCEEERGKEVAAHIQAGTALGNCTVLSEKLQKLNDDCVSNLTISRKSLQLCVDNVTDHRYKRQQAFNECEVTRFELEKKLADAMPHGETVPERLDIPLHMRKYLKVVLLRGYVTNARLFGINPELQSSTFLSKYATSYQFTPAVPIIPPRLLLVSICGEHCAELRRKRLPTDPLLTTKYSFNDPPPETGVRRYKTATGLSLEVTGSVHIWEQRFPLDTDEFHVSFFKSKKTHFFALREEGKNFEYCVCPFYDKDLFNEADDFLDNMSQVDKALVSGEVKEREQEDPMVYWQRTQEQARMQQQQQQLQQQEQRFNRYQQNYPQFEAQRKSSRGYPYPNEKLHFDSSVNQRRRSGNGDPLNEMQRDTHPMKNARGTYHTYRQMPQPAASHRSWSRH